MKSRIQFKHLLGIGLMMLVLVTAGCLLTTITETLVLYTDAPISITTPPGYGSRTIDFKDNEDWEDNKDRIKSVESVEFALKVSNGTTSDVTGQVYVSDKGNLTSKAAIESDAILVLDGIVVPPEGREIKREESVDFLKNIEQFLDLLENNVKETDSLHVYGISPTPNFSLVIAESMAVIVTFTADAE